MSLKVGITVFLVLVVYPLVSRYLLSRGWTVGLPYALPVIVYCANVNCDSSTHGAEKLIAAGFTNVYDMAEGHQGWQQAFNEKEGGRKAKEDAPSKTIGRTT